VCRNHVANCDWLSGCKWSAVERHGNGPNNRRSNLTLCNARQNSFNIRLPSLHSQYVRVLRCGSLWPVHPYHDGLEHSLGVIATRLTVQHCNPGLP
jgi:hypothetical protein